MGQLQCSKFEEDYQINRMTLEYQSTTKNDNYQNRSGSLSQLYEIGKNLNIGKNEKLDNEWEAKLSTFVQYDNQMQKSQNYTNSLEKSFKQEVLEGLPLITDDSEYYMYRFFVQEQQEFRNYGMMGIPQKYRWAYWKVITLQKDIKSKKIVEIDQEAHHSIVKDINRTLISNVFREEQAKQKLDIVLKFIALKYPQVGYCQGMNYIAALLLTVSGLKEQETAQVFASLIHNPFYLLDLLFKNELPLLFLLEFVVMTLMKQKLPKVHQHFEKTETPSSFWLSKILLSGFVYLFGVRDCVLFWDYIFIRGTVLGYTELILGMLSLFQKEILQKDQVQLAEFFSFQEKNCSEQIIKKTIQNEKIDSKVIRKIVKSNKKLALYNLFLKFGKPEFDQMYKDMDKI